MDGNPTKLTKDIHLEAISYFEGIYNNGVSSSLLAQRSVLSNIP